MTRLDSPEVKGTLAEEHVAAALKAFGLTAAKGQERLIYLCEDVTPQTSAGTPLLDANVIPAGPDLVRRRGTRPSCCGRPGRRSCRPATELVRSRGCTPERNQQPRTTLVLKKLVEQFLAQPR